MRSLLKTLLCQILDSIWVAIASLLVRTAGGLGDDLLLLHRIGPVSLAFKDLQVNTLVIRLCFLGSDQLLHKLLLALSELEGLAHPVQLSYTVMMIAPIVIMSQTVLILS